jgi:hypothetical protein
MLFDLGLPSLAHRVQDVEDLMVPAELLVGLRINLSYRRP